MTLNDRYGIIYAAEFKEIVMDLISKDKPGIWVIGEFQCGFIR